MTKINIPFEWSLDIPSVVEFTFQMDSERAGDTEGDMEELISFIVDLKTGDILWAHDYLKEGIAYPYNSSYYFLVVGNGWYNGTDGSEDYNLYPNDEVKNGIVNMLNKNGNYLKIVEQVCELGGEGALNKIKSDYNDIYQKHIKTEKPDCYI